MKITLDELRRLKPWQKENLSELELEYCGKTQGMDVSKLLIDVPYLTKLDLSGFDFTGVANMRQMFKDLKNLSEVILSDTLLRAKCPVKRVLNRNKLPKGAFIDEYGEPCYHGYGNAGPYSAYEDRIAVPDFQLEYTSFGFDQTTKAEWREYLGLNNIAELTIVPHKKQSEEI